MSTLTHHGNRRYPHYRQPDCSVFFTLPAPARYNRSFNGLTLQMQVHFGGHPGDTFPPCALTIGNFDGVHLGHQAILRDLRREADARGLPTALLTFEPHPREFFSRNDPPARLATLRDKLAFLQGTGLVDRVHVQRFNRGFASLSPQAFIDSVLVERLDTRFLLIGDDFCFGSRRTGDFSLLAAEPRFTTRAMPTVELDGARASSTAIRDALEAGDMPLAARLLGRPYQLSGRVVHGRKLGRTLGFPTANIHLPHRKPALAGVFAVECLTPDGQRHVGAASLGKNPTIDDAGCYRLEVYLLDYSGDLYGQRLIVRFIHKLRDEEKYDSLDALIAQIHADVAETRRLMPC